MRIIAGQFRRRKLLANPGDTTRPITDRAKEVLFERLANDVDGKRIADIFSGTGSMGLEALSRGATGVVFVENDRRAIELLRKNVASLGVEDETLCWETDATRSSFRPRGVDHLVPFDTVFFDPPYRMIAGLRMGSVMYRSLERLLRDGVTSERALLVLRTPRDADFEVPPDWRFDRTLTIKGMAIHLFDKGAENDADETGRQSGVDFEQDKTP